MNNIIDAKNAAEKLSLRELKALRAWIGDRIGRMEREETKVQQQSEIPSKEQAQLNEIVGKLKSIAVFLLFALTSCNSNVIPHNARVSAVLWSYCGKVDLNAVWVYRDGRKGTVQCKSKNVIYKMIRDQKGWPKCTKCEYVTKEGICWRH